jgi:SAM-dependent methyltransferase
MSAGTVLHPGCGNEPLPEWLEKLTEVRLDIDASCHPDIVASITEMGDIGEFDMVYTSHTLEHLYDYDVQKALKEFYRVLKPEGVAVIIVPDVEGVLCNREVLYESPCGPICGIDLYYGLTRYVEQNPYYAHHMAFVQETLADELKKAGFDFVTTKRLENYNLMGVGKKGEAK